MKIMLEPTNAVETFKGVQFRLFKGVTSMGSIPVQMLGMFRIADAIQRAQFVAQLTEAVQHETPMVTPMIAADTLITGAEGVVPKRREIAARAIEAAFLQGRAVPQHAASTQREGSWTDFLPVADALLAKMEQAR